MTESHSDRADRFAEDASDALAAALDRSREAVGEGTLTRPETVALLAEYWARVAALQRQAELHARLAAGEAGLYLPG